MARITQGVKILVKDPSGSMWVVINQQWIAKILNATVCTHRTLSEVKPFRDYSLEAWRLQQINKLGSCIVAIKQAKAGNRDSEDLVAKGHSFYIYKSRSNRRLYLLNALAEARAVVEEILYQLRYSPTLHSPLPNLGFRESEFVKTRLIVQELVQHTSSPGQEFNIEIANWSKTKRNFRAHIPITKNFADSEGGILNHEFWSHINPALKEPLKQCFQRLFDEKVFVYDSTFEDQLTRILDKWEPYIVKMSHSRRHKIPFSLAKRALLKNIL